jgi:hypothetical protein
MVDIVHHPSFDRRRRQGIGATVQQQREIPGAERDVRADRDRCDMRLGI